MVNHRLYNVDNNLVNVINTLLAMKLMKKINFYLSKCFEINKIHYLRLKPMIHKAVYNTFNFKGHVLEKKVARPEHRFS